MRTNLKYIKNSNVLITGGVGFIGAHLAKFLDENGAKVTIFDSFLPSGDVANILSKTERINFIKADIQEYPELINIIKKNKISRIVHAAAIFDPMYSRDYPYNTYKVNIIGTLNVLEASRFFNIQRLVNISTISVYFYKEYEPMDEYHPVHSPEGGDTVSHYGPSKVCTEIMALNYFSVNKLDCISLRLSAVFGFGMKPLIYVKQMVENAIHGKPTDLPSQGPPRDIIYIKDVVEAISNVLYAEPQKLNHRVYLIASGKMVTPFDLKRAILSVFPDAKININPMMTELEKLDASRRSRIDIRLVKKELNFRPKYNLTESVKDYALDHKAYKR